MKKDESPFLFSRFFYYFLTYDLLSNNYLRALDLGCGSGEFIGNLSKDNKLYGYDVDPSKIKIARKKFRNVKFTLGKVGQKFPYKNNFFDCIFLFHVLEHVDSEEDTIREIYRVLKKKGELYLAVPHKGIFSWADLANMRFRFPTVHKFFASKFYGARVYKRLFVENKNMGLCGDLSSTREEHHHYSEREIKKLFGKKFVIKRVYKYSLFQPFLLNFENLMKFIFKSEVRFMQRLIWLDSKIYCGDLAYNVLIVAKKDDSKI